MTLIYGKHMIRLSTDKIYKKFILMHIRNYLKFWETHIYIIHIEIIFFLFINNFLSKTLIIKLFISIWLSRHPPPFNLVGPCDFHIILGLLFLHIHILQFYIYSSFDNDYYLLTCSFFIFITHLSSSYIPHHIWQIHLSWNHVCLPLMTIYYKYLFFPCTYHLGVVCF